MAVKKSLIVMDRWFLQSPPEFANTFHVLFTRWIPLKDLASIPSGVPGYCMVIKNRKAREPVSSSTHHPPTVATRSVEIFHATAAPLIISITDVVHSSM